MSQKGKQSKLYGFFTKRPRCDEPSASAALDLDPNIVNIERVRVQQEIAQQGTSSQPQVHDNSLRIEADPGLRLPLSRLASNPKELEMIRRAYLLKGPCQPRLSNFPQTLIYNAPRRFNVDWYGEFHWLEYSESKDASYCLYCYLFKPQHGDQGGGGTFVSEGYTNWNIKKGFKKHMGNHDSIHNHCYMASQDLLNTSAHIDVSIENKNKETKREYYVRVRTSVKAVRYLLRQGLAFRGHDESKNSLNKGNFLQLLELMGEDNEEVKRVILDNAPGNCILKSPTIQKEIISAFAHFVSKSIVCDIGDDFFALLVDEARDVSIKEQMAVAIRYVNHEGKIMERFLGIVCVPNTTARCLKASLESLLSTFGLSLSRVRGQGYDGASNMQGEFNGLKSLILKENKCAFYVHCFAHQLQLALVQITKKNMQLSEFFGFLSSLANIVGGSCKRQELLRDKQFEKVMERVSFDDLETGKGLNQEGTLKRPGDTRWNSYYFTIVSLIKLFSSVVGVLEHLQESGEDAAHSGQAKTLLRNICCFEFAFVLHLMKSVLGITLDLSLALQRKDQDLVNAMKLVKIAKERLQELREHGWDNLINETTNFCDENDIWVPSMEDNFIIYSRDGRISRRGVQVSNLIHYRVEVFYVVIDSQLSELNDRFDNTNTELLSLIACLDPINSFASFDKKALIKLAMFYPYEFDDFALDVLDSQLENYIRDVRNDEDFSLVLDTSGLAQKLVAKNKHKTYPLVYMLIKLSLILPVATATVERIFSAMKIVKSELRNRMGDDMLNDSLVSYVEKDVLDDVSVDEVINHFQEMSVRRISL